MAQRKLQLIAGTTYTISLPKKWVMKNNLSAQDEISLVEKDDQTLVVSAILSETKTRGSISLSIDKYETQLHELMFALYYQGYEDITLHSSKGITKEARASIRKALTYMSGTEISFEDSKKIVIRVLLDKSRVDILQVIYRISLIIDLTIELLKTKDRIEDIRTNEDEVDRLFQLINKTISLSLQDPQTLMTSKIESMALITHYFLISKRLENLHDNLSYLAEYLVEWDVDVPSFESLMYCKETLSSVISRLMKQKHHERKNQEKFQKVLDSAGKLRDKKITGYLQEILKYVSDIEEEVNYISLHKKLSSEEGI